MSMKIGTETGSLMNAVMSGDTTEPVVGMAATVLGWTDRKGATVIGWDGTTLTVQEDHAKRVDSNGMSEMQKWEHTPNPNGITTTYRRHKKTGRFKGGWVNPETKRWSFGDGGVLLGERRHYHDFSF